MLLHPSAQQDMLTQVLGSQVTPGFLDDVMSYLMSYHSLATQTLKNNRTKKLFDLVKDGLTRSVVLRFGINLSPAPHLKKKYA